MSLSALLQPRTSCSRSSSTTGAQADTIIVIREQLNKSKQLPGLSKHSNQVRGSCHKSHTRSHSRQSHTGASLWDDNC